MIVTTKLKKGKFEMSILEKFCISLMSAAVALIVSYYTCICNLTTHASYIRIAAKSSLLIFFAAIGLLHVYQFWLAMGQVRRQIVACGWMLLSALGLAVVKIWFVL